VTSDTAQRRSSMELGFFVPSPLGVAYSTKTDTAGDIIVAEGTPPRHQEAG
jgi:hypothetical protein